ncbi:MAG TPA: transcription antitermination factor NusB [Terriglobales bacterium]|nr:transcription antitermination factor NusB [Terriglobales bacterium]
MSAGQLGTHFGNAKIIMGMRRKGRELAVQGLYQLEMRGDPFLTLETFWKQADGSERAKDFGRGLVQGVTEFRDEINGLISEAAQNWRIERLSAVDVCVLRVATYELLKRREVPTSVILDEAIEIARRFSTGESASFVNGVLDQIALKLGVKDNRGTTVESDSDDE